MRDDANKLRWVVIARVSDAVQPGHRHARELRHAEFGCQVVYGVATPESRQGQTATTRSPTFHLLACGRHGTIQYRTASRHMLGRLCAAEGWCE